MKESRPSILYLASHCPGGSVYGAQLRVLNIGRLLRRLGTVEVLLVADNPVEESAIKKAREEFGQIQILPAPEAKLGGWVNRLRHELDPSFLGTYPAAMSAQDRDSLRRRAAQADLVWVHSIRTANITGVLRWPKSVLDIDDLPSLHYGSEVEAPDGPWRRLLDRRMAWIWRRREDYLHRRFDVLTVCSQLDKTRLGHSERVHVIRNGFEAVSECSRGTVCAPASQPRLGFIGTFNWEPNVQGVDWFVRSVWPVVLAAFPKAQLRLVGAGSERFDDKTRQVVGLGYLADADAEMSSWQAFLVPLQVGAGTRVKIAEGFAKRIPVVSTSVGAYGYEVTNGIEMLLADSPADFGEACVRLLREPELRTRLTERAHRRFLKEWTWDAQFPAVEAAVRQCLEISKANLG